MSKVTIYPLDKLFNECATHCEAYAACGGNRSTMPCGCAWKPNSKAWKQCDTCYIICRSRTKPGLNGRIADFIPHITAGKSLDQLSICQKFTAKLPIFIPTRTEDFHNNGQLLPLRWVAADVRTLFNCRKYKGAKLKPSFDTKDKALHHLNVSSGCHLLAVFNGKDKSLESLWGMGQQRKEAIQRLHNLGFALGTGATYSISNLTTTGTQVPYSHHTVMLMRHHQVLSEIDDVGMGAIPNLYWLDNDEFQKIQWTNWLRNNPQIKTISRDFTSTHNSKTIFKKFNELLEIMEKAGRSFHVIIVGTGSVNAPIIIRELAKAGHSGTIVTGAPIMDALKNKKYQLDSDSNTITKVISDIKHPFSEIIMHNLQTFEKCLLQASLRTGVEQQISANISMNHCESHFLLS